MHNDGELLNTSLALEYKPWGYRTPQHLSNSPKQLRFLNIYRSVEHQALKAGSHYLLLYKWAGRGKLFERCVESLKSAIRYVQKIHSQVRFCKYS